MKVAAIEKEDRQGLGCVGVPRVMSARPSGDKEAGGLLGLQADGCPLWARDRMPC